MKLAKMYSVAKVVEDNCGDHNLTAFAFDRSLVILEGPDGVLVVNNEGIHYKFDSTAEVYEVDCCPNDEGEDGKHKFYMCANAVFKVPLKDIMAEAEVTEVDLGTFVRTFGARLETNYHVLMDSVKEIGLDPADYPRKKKAIAR